MVISMLKIRRPLGRLIFNMGIAIPGKTVFLIETAPWPPSPRRHFQTHFLEQIYYMFFRISLKNPDSKVHGDNMGPTWVLSPPDGPHVGSLNLAIRVCSQAASHQYVSIGSDDILASNRRHAMVWTNVGLMLLFYWRIYASLGLSRLRQGWQ